MVYLMLYVMLRSRIAGRVDVHFPSIVIPRVLIALFMFVYAHVYMYIYAMCAARICTRASGSNPGVPQHVLHL